MNNHTYINVRAVYHEGVLTVLDPLQLPDGAQVQLDIHVQEQMSPPQVNLVYPTKSIPARELGRLIGIIEVGGDALEDSEAIYDSDWD
jgi:predicted DNA-binding antitoxin AbrB/MazE fold protein